MQKLKHKKPARRPGARTGRPLHVLRAEGKITQIAIATRTGLTQTRYWQIENGAGAPVRHLEREVIARVLGVSPNAIAWPVMTPSKIQLARAEAAERRRQQLMMVATGA